MDLRVVHIHTVPYLFSVFCYFRPTMIILKQVLRTSALYFLFAVPTFGSPRRLTCPFPWFSLLKMADIFYMRRQCLVKHCAWFLFSSLFLLRRVYFYQVPLPILSFNAYFEFQLHSPIYALFSTHEPFGGTQHNSLLFARSFFVIYMSNPAVSHEYLQSPVPTSHKHLFSCHLRR